MKENLMSSQLPDKDVAAIKDLLIEKWVRLCLDADWGGFAGLLTDDFVFMPPDLPIVDAKQAAIAWAREFPPMKKFNSILVRAEGRDDFASTRGTYTMTVESEPGRPASMKGKWTCTCRKQPDGSWRVASNMWNVDGPLAAG